MIPHKLSQNVQNDENIYIYIYIYQQRNNNKIKYQEEKQQRLLEKMRFNLQKLSNKHKKSHNFTYKNYK